MSSRHLLQTRRQHNYHHQNHHQPPSGSPRVEASAFVEKSAKTKAKVTTEADM